MFQTAIEIVVNALASDLISSLDYITGNLAQYEFRKSSIVEDLRQKGVGFKSICDGAIDTTTASGELIFNIFSSLAQFERRLIQERTNAGLKSARARGRLGGRPRIDKESPKIRLARKMHSDKNVPIDDICASLKISRATLYRYLQA